MIRKFLLLWFLWNLTLMLWAQVSSNDDALSKIDSIYVRQKRMMGAEKELLDYAIDDPLSDKNWGIEMNLIRLLYYDKKEGGISGTVSFFGINRKAEIAFPFLIQEGESQDGIDDVDFFTIDCHYRYFLGRHQKGFYISAFLRYAHLKGYKADDVNGSTYLSRGKCTENKLGIGFGIGWRIFSHKGFYWGTSLNVGRFVTGKNGYLYDADPFDARLDNDYEFIFDIEFLKFGWAF